MTKRTLTILATALLALGITAAPALASGWTANPGASYHNGVVTLDNSGGGTSYENADLAVPIENGDQITFEYRSTDGNDVCSGGTPRVFVRGGAYNTHNAAMNSGQTCESRTTAADADGWRTVTGTISNVSAGSAGHVGIVNDNPSNVRTLEVRNLSIAGVQVFAANMDECKKGGWQTGPYQNQGDCVSSFARAR